MGGRSALIDLEDMGCLGSPQGGKWTNKWWRVDRGLGEKWLAPENQGRGGERASNKVKGGQARHV